MYGPVRGAQRTRARRLHGGGGRAGLCAWRPPAGHAVSWWRGADCATAVYAWCHGVRSPRPRRRRATVDRAGVLVRGAALFFCLVFALARRAC
eukprot:486831-Prymnesium_polylepis.1